MTDKKSCESCWHNRKHVLPSEIPCPRRACNICKHWFRNHRLWLSILPEETGYYWYKKKNQTKNLTCYMCPG
jgi:hypothetical protein